MSRRPDNCCSTVKVYLTKFCQVTTRSQPSVRIALQYWRCMHYQTYWNQYFSTTNTHWRTLTTPAVRAGGKSSCNAVAEIPIEVKGEQQPFCVILPEYFMNLLYSPHFGCGGSEIKNVGTSYFGKQDMAESRPQVSTEVSAQIRLAHYLIKCLLAQNQPSLYSPLFVQLLQKG